MQDAEAEARRIVDRYWDQILEAEPILGTEVGDERFDDRLPDVSDEGRAKRETFQRAALEAIDSIPTGDLDADLRTSLDIMAAAARRDVAEIEHRWDRFAAVTHLFGPGQILADIGSLQRADTPDRLERFERRLSEIPRYLEDMAVIARDGARVGQTVPKVVIDRTIAQVERLIAMPAEESPALMPLAEDQTEARTRVTELVRDRIMPAYERYLEVLREYAPSATETIGLSALPDGDQLYATQILAWTTLPLEPQRVHDLGVEDLAKIQEERRQIAEELGYPDAEKAVEAHNADGKNFASSREELVRLAEDQVRKGWDAAPRFFGRLPDDNCEVRAVEEFREADMPFAFYMSPTEDGSRKGIYYVNAYELPERPLHHLATTTYHEANPGHHFQLSIEQEFGDRPALRRFGGILGGSAFIEGWGLYSERLADEMELFTDPFERLGMLDAQAHRAARLIVDTGIHALGWDRDRAIHQLEEAGVPHLDAVIETDRYISWPGQALSYKIGQLEIERWRRNAEEREGSAFSLSDFHDKLLALGSLPLPSLQRELGEA
jgi:prolyl oligopeptidase